LLKISKTLADSKRVNYCEYVFSSLFSWRSWPFCFEKLKKCSIKPMFLLEKCSKFAYFVFEKMSLRAILFVLTGVSYDKSKN